MAELPINYLDTWKVARDKINDSFNALVEQVEWYEPHIVDWIWWIWETNTWVKAEWDNVQMKVEWNYIRYKTDSISWTTLILLSDLKGEKWDTGDKGDAFVYSDFTEEQLAALKWPQGSKWDKGEKWDKWDKGEKWDTGITWPEGQQWPRGAQWPKWDDWADWQDGRWISSVTSSKSWKTTTVTMNYTDWSTPTTFQVQDWADWQWAWDVLWPSSSTDWDIALFDWATWKLIKDSGISVTDMNTKTFTLSSTSDLTNAQAAYDWILSWKTWFVKVGTSQYLYKSYSAWASLVVFTCAEFLQQKDNASDSQIKYPLLRFYAGDGVVTNIIQSDWLVALKSLATWVNYSTPYTPEYAGSPATKKYVDDKYADLMAKWKFLSLWDCTTWQPLSFPLDTPYTYHTGDYFMVETVSSATPPVNYKPNGSSYTGTASSTTETWEVKVWDFYVYDGSVWLLASNHWKTVSFANLAWQPSDNANLETALNAKANATDLNTKTFFLSSTSDLINAQAAYDWYNAGKNAIIVYSDISYELSLTWNDGLTFYNPRLATSDGSLASTTSVTHKTIKLLVTNNVVTSISSGNSWYYTLRTDKDYSTPYTPLYDWSPATKKYVDDYHDSSKQDALTLPSTPTQWHLVTWWANNKTLVDGWDIPTGVPSGWTNWDVLTNVNWTPTWQAPSGWIITTSVEIPRTNRGWEDASKRISNKTVNVSWVTASNTVIVSPDVNYIADYINSGMCCVSQWDGTLKFIKRGGNLMNNITVNVVIIN